MLQLYRRRGPLEPISQGDILKGVNCVDSATGPEGQRNTVMVVSHGCEIDKPSAKSCYVADVKSLETIPENQKGSIRQGKVAAVIYLPLLEPLGGESFVDLRTMYRVQLSQLCASELRTEPNGDRVRMLTDPSIRVGALSDDGVTVLHGQLILFFTRRK